MWQPILAVLLCASLVAAIPRPSGDDEEDICSMPPVEPSPIVCAGAFPKWFFNAESKSCESYLYGGCGGTKNLFNSEYACIAKCNRQALLRARGAFQPPAPAEETTTTAPVEVDVCSLPPVRPSPFACAGAFPKWTFNSASGACESYLYGGCGGTENLFANEYTCLAKCNRQALLRARGAPQPATPADETDEGDLCLMPPIKPGPIACLGAFPKYTFNSSSGTCEPYIYGGCGGTKNLFDSDYACTATCNRKALLRGPAAEAKPELSACHLPRVEGPCKAQVERFYFDKSTGACSSFSYSGCRGNANNFETLAECQNTCRQHLIGTIQTPVTLPAPIQSEKQNEDICSLPPVKTKDGTSCFAFIPSWTFNSTSGQCENYIYGGCGKTANLFRTEKECKATCSLKPDATTESNPSE